MLFLDQLPSQCSTIMPIIKLIKFGVIPLIQVVIIVALIVLLIIDFGKAVMAGKEDEIKSAQKLAIKRVIYAVVVFIVPWLVQVAFGLLDSTDKNIEDPQNSHVSALRCYTVAERNS